MSFYTAHTLNLDTQEWSITEFTTRRDAALYIRAQFKYPGDYNLRHAEGVWNEQAKIFQNTNSYPKYLNKSLDYVKHWNFEKDKSSYRGFIIYKKPSENLEFILPGLYYFYLNYCPIPDKMKSKLDFSEIWDGDYHYYIYILLCIIERKFGVVLKARQKGYTLKNMSIFLNRIWFGEAAVAKIFAQEESKVKDSWGFMEIYRDHINNYCGWKRGFDPGKKLDWQIRRRQTDGSYSGNMSIGKGFTTKQDPTNGIGGNADILYGEECYGKGTKILMANGSFKQVEALVEGDLVMSRGGFPNSITRLIRGTSDLFSIEQKKGINYVVTGNHKLVLDRRDYYNNTISEVCLSVQECIALKHQNKFNTSHYNYYGKKSPITFDKQNVSIDPYLLGVWLGDGYKKELSITLNLTKDPEIYNYILDYCNVCKIKYRIKRNSVIEYNDDVVQIFLNDSSTLPKKLLKELNIWNNKHIPDSYKFNDEPTRLSILAGIIDTDGSLHRATRSYNFAYEISSSNSVLKDDIVYLARSVGLYVKVINVGPSSSMYKGRAINSTAHFRLILRGDISKIPVKVFRKQVPKAWTPTSNPQHTVIDIKPIGVGEHYGFTLEKDPVHYLEDFTLSHNSGANSTLDLTHEFITSNVAIGGLTTGLIVYSGAVGQLDKAEPLKEFIIHPDQHGFLSCPNNIEDDIEFGDKVGFFAAEWWNYISVEEDAEGNQFGEILKCYDRDGNTNKELALSEINKFRAVAKAKGPEKYRYYCSQRPLSIREAFAWRKESKFPANLVQSQTRRIQEKQYPVEWLDIERGEDMQLKFVPAKKTPIREFPINKGAVDKEGCIEVYERPAPNPELGDYIVSIDPIRDGKTVTSYSLFCILGYRVDKEVREYGDEVKSWIEPGKLVFEWTGRFDDHNKTCELAAQLIKMYNARAVVEANAYEFCTYMISKRMQHHLVAKNQMLFLKEFGANEQAFQEFGWKNTGNPSLFEKHLISYINGFLQEELDTIKNENTGVVFKTVYGIERIPSLMIMKEMGSYQPGLNVDRLIALGGLIAYLKLYLANYGYKLKEQAVDRKKEDPTKYLKPRSFFKQAGDIPDEFRSQMPRSPFRNLK